MSDDEFLDLMDALWGVGGGDSLWAIALEDSDPEPAVIDPAMEARAARDIALAGDLLMTPPDFDSVWPEAHDVDFGPLMADHDAAQADWSLPDRDDYQPKFPIDPDEEVGW